MQATTSVTIQFPFNKPTLSVKVSSWRHLNQALCVHCGARPCIRWDNTAVLLVYWNAHMQEHTKGYLHRMRCWISHQNFSVLSLFSQSRFESDGVWESPERGLCRDLILSHQGCMWSKDLNEYTISGLFIPSLDCAGNSQSAVYLIIAPCLCFPGAAQVWLLCCRGNLRGITEKGEWVINSHYHEITSWSLGSKQK